MSKRWLHAKEGLNSINLIYSLQHEDNLVNKNPISTFSFHFSLEKKLYKGLKCLIIVPLLITKLKINTNSSIKMIDLAIKIFICHEIKYLTQIKYN